MAHSPDAPFFTALPADIAQVRDGAKWARVQPDVIPAWIADMDFPVAEPIQDALTRRATTDLGYPAWLVEPGAGPLAEVFAERMARRYGWQPNPGHVRTYTDLNQAVQVLLHVMTRPGDVVALHTPGYHPFLNTIKEMGRRLLPIPVSADGRFEIPAEPARVLLLVNPHNPSGRVFTQAELQSLAEYAEHWDALVLSDEIHADLTYAPARHIPFATLAPERTITLTSATKAFNMGGIRCSVAHVGSRAAREALDRQPMHLYGTVSVVSVEATIAAWRHGGTWLAEVMRVLDRNRHQIATRLAGRVTYRVPEGTYLAWLDFGIADAADFLEREARVVLSPGPLYGGGDTWARLNFATPEPILAKILDRISAALSRRDGADQPFRERY